MDLVKHKQIQVLIIKKKKKIMGKSQKLRLNMKVWSNLMFKKF